MSETRAPAMTMPSLKLLVSCSLLALVACDSAEPAAPAAEAKPTGEAKAPAADEGKAPAENAEAAEKADEAEDAKAATPPGEKLNLNTATKEQFMTVPDVGKRMAHEFDEYRPYVSIAQFRKEIGKYVDAEQVAKFEAYVFVPVDYNNCDADTLQQLEGVDAKVAEGLIAGRPYADQGAFLAKLEESAGPEAKAKAAEMLTEAPAK